MLQFSKKDINLQIKSINLQYQSLCYIDFEDLQNKDIRLLTFKDLHEHHEMFIKNGCDKIKGKQSFSTVNKSLIVGEPDLPVISICSVPELHVMEGITNHLYNDGMVPIFGRENLESCIKEIGVSLNPRGDAFNGNNSMKLLTNCRKLLENDDIDDVTMTPFVEGMEALKNLVDLCFTASDFDEKNADKIIDAVTYLKQKYLACNVSITLKAHVIFCHVIDALKYSKGKQLGFLSEQCGEAIHFDFYKTWQNYQVPVHSKNYEQKLLSAVVTYSSFHL